MTSSSHHHSIYDCYYYKSYWGSHQLLGLLAVVNIREPHFRKPLWWDNWMGNLNLKLWLILPQSSWKCSMIGTDGLYFAKEKVMSVELNKHMDISKLYWDFFSQRTALIPVKVQAKPCFPTVGWSTCQHFILSQWVQKLRWQREGLMSD